MALEVVGGAFLSSVLNVLFERLASQEVKDLFREKKLIAGLLEKLEVTLLSANNLLNDAEDKQIADVDVKKWVDLLSEVLNEADVVVDKINTKALGREIEGRSRRSWCNMGCNTLIALPNSFDDVVVRSEIENVLGRLSFVLDQKDLLGLREGVQSKRLERLPAPLVGDPSDVYGRDREKEAMFELLVSENVVGSSDKISVIPIVGMGGIGKTTLARLVYNDERLKSHFERKTWITVSDDFNVLRLAKAILKGFTSEDCNADELDQVQARFEAAMGGKKFLLVLDDVWNEDYNRWTVLKSFFEFRTCDSGSKIVVTTRSESVASIMGTVPFQSIEAMSDGDCWQLFKRHAFLPDIEPSVFVELERLGRGIVAKCKGLPLAVKALAGLLRSVTNLREWKKILDSDVWDLQKKGDNMILPSLWLSFSYLPSNLKRCFAYCSIFPKDHEYEKNKLVLLWMADGLLEGEDLEDIGEECYQTLISRSLFQRSNKEASSVHLHDLVHDLALFVSGKDFSAALLFDSNLHNFTIKTRHLLCDKYIIHTRSLDSLKDNRVRTLVPLMPSRPHFYARNTRTGAWLKQFGCLRALSLEQNHIWKVPDPIGKLKHLRYLDLSNTQIKMLPSSICTLYNLQTLVLHQCPMLTRLPEKMGSLVKLRHLDLSYTCNLKKMPLHGWNLRRLRTLTKLVLNDELSGSRIKELRELSQCHSDGSFEIVGLENVTDAKDVSGAEFKQKHLLTRLALSWLGENSDPEKHRAVLDALQPHPNLKKLDIVGYGGKEFSTWVANNSFSNITEVSLSDCKHCQLPPLRQLPSLQNLVISGLSSVKTIGSEFYGSSGTVSFISLEYLGIGCLNGLESWSFEDGAFPNLKTLRLFRCPMLKSISPHSLPLLKDLEVHECERIEALLPIGRDMNTVFPTLKRFRMNDCPKLEVSGFAGFPQW